MRRPMIWCPTHDPEMSRDGWDSQKNELHIKQQHGELEDNVDIRWSGVWVG